MIDYEYYTAIVYPKQAGGKFLANCLALNDNGVFQDSILAQLQCNNNFSVQDKIDYLDKKLQQAKVERRWSDLGLGHGELFGIDANAYNTDFHELLYQQINSGVVLNCMRKKLHLFADVQSHSTLYNVQKFWTNAKIIVFTNYRKFIDTRLKQTDDFDGLLQYWDSIKAESWPADPPKNNSEFSQLPYCIQTELDSVYHREITKFFSVTQDHDLLWTNKTNALKKQNNVFEFDVSYAYTNCNQFYEVYTQACNFLKLPIQDKNTIDWYFNLWYNVITQGVK